MISELFLQELKSYSDIEQVVSPYVHLKRRGRVATGLCPFHSEKTPSFTVYPDNQSFYCFLSAIMKDRTGKVRSFLFVGKLFLESIFKFQLVLQFQNQFLRRLFTDSRCFGDSCRIVCQNRKPQIIR